MDKLKISVVTVCLNAADTIEKTVLSVLSQTYENIEYIVMDGQSGDGTLDILKKYENDSKVRIFSGKDTGLYNAMNKGIDVCSGDYVIFLNSGDLFADNQVLENTVSKIQGDSETNCGELFYGNVIRSYEGETKLEKYPGKHVVFRLLMMGRMPCHQGIFTGIDTIRKYRFDESYKICADFDFLMRCLRGHVRMAYLDVNVSIVDCVNGISSQGMNLDHMRAEDDRSIRYNYPLFFWMMCIPKKIVRKSMMLNEKKKLSSILVNMVSVVDILIIRLRNRKKESQDNSLILVRLDAIGDFVMWLDAAKAFREEDFDKIILICNQVCKDIAVNTGYFDEVIGVDYGKLRRTSRIKYRWSIHRLLKHIEGKRAVQCTYSKEIFSDVVMSAITAEEKITMDSPQIITVRWTYRFAKKIYQQIMQTPHESISEIRRNAIFTGHVLGKEIKSGVPILQDVESAKKRVPKETYYLLFLGASEPERMWPIERFAQIAEMLFCDERYARLKCCIGGSKQERYLYEQFCQEYSKDNVIDQVGKTTLPELIEIIRKAEFIITNDTSAVHFAAAVDTPAICLWGPWEYGRFLPYDVEQKNDRKLPIVCYHETDCRNCLLNGTHKTRDCEQFIIKHGIRKCLDKVTVEDVMQKLKFL